MRILILKKTITESPKYYLYDLLNFLQRYAYTCILHVCIPTLLYVHMCRVSEIEFLLCSCSFYIHLFATSPKIFYKHFYIHNLKMRYCKIYLEFKNG